AGIPGPRRTQRVQSPEPRRRSRPPGPVPSPRCAPCKDEGCQSTTSSACLLVSAARTRILRRTCHNPYAPEFMDLCDKLGFMVMNEVFDEWKQNKTRYGYSQYFDEWSERDVASFVRRDRNHPSVLLWSSGNEIG